MKNDNDNLYRKMGNRSPFFLFILENTLFLCFFKSFNFNILRFLRNLNFKDEFAIILGNFSKIIEKNRFQKIKKNKLFSKSNLSNAYCQILLKKHYVNIQLNGLKHHINQ